MDLVQLAQLAQDLISGKKTPAEAVAAFRPPSGTQAASPPRNEVHLDLDRQRRCGFPEVVFGENKSPALLAGILRGLLEAGQPAFATRVSADKFAEIAKELPGGIYNEVARTLRFEVVAGSNSNPDLITARTLVGFVPVVTAGSSDLPVAEEARETLAWMGVRTAIIADVGVAGPHRFPERLAELEGADAVVVVAGMEGALPSVVGGYVPCPVLAAPTSVGYGAAFGGVAALLGMLNSCAANVAVVNIDAGFKAGYLAGLIARRRHA